MGSARVLGDIADSARALLKDRMCEGTDGQVVLVAVIGTWRRVEILNRRVLSAPSMPKDLEREVQAEGSLVAPAVLRKIEQDWESEVHEAVVHLTEEDEGQMLQIVAFHVGLSAAFEQAFDGADVKPTKKDLTDSGDADANREKELGTVIPPARWVLAEYIVENAALMPFDEDEMERPIDEETEEEKTQNMLKQLMQHFDKVRYIQCEPSSPHKVQRETTLPQTHTST